MEESGWNKAELARRSGVHAQSVNGYLLGRLNPVNLLPPLMQHGLDPYWFVQGITSDEVRRVEAEIIRILHRNGVHTADDAKHLIGKAYKFEHITKPENINGITHEVIGQAIKNAEKRPI